MVTESPDGNVYGSQSSPTAHSPADMQFSPARRLKPHERHLLAEGQPNYSPATHGNINECYFLRHLLAEGTPNYSPATHGKIWGYEENFRIERYSLSYFDVDSQFIHTILINVIKRKPHI
jgi:hypothetical protein